MNVRVSGALLLTLILGLFLGGAQSWAAPPPTLEVSTIGKGTVTGVSGAINCGSGALTCSTGFGSSGGTVTLKEAPADGWTFSGWDDGSGGPSPCSSTTATTCTITVGGDKTVYALFSTSGAVTVTTLNATVTQDGATAEGRIQNNSTTNPIDCGTDTGGTGATCSLELVAGSTITLTETTNTGYVFDHWGGSCTGTHTTCSVYMGGNRTVAGDFVTAGTNSLVVTVSGAGTVTGGGVNCSNGAECTVDEPSDAKVTLTETPADGYAFAGWSQDCAGVQPTCSVEMSDTHAVTATFTPVVPVLLSVNGAGTITGPGMACGPGPATCNGSATPDTTIEFTATPTTTGGTVSWIGCTTASGTLCTVEVGTDPIAVTATFSGGTTGGGGSGSFVTLSVSVTGNGVVTTTSTSGPAIWCTASGGSGCTATVQQNTSVQLHAIPASGLSGDFQGWGGSCTSGLSTTCTLVMASAKTAIAGFAGSYSTVQLTGSVSGSGTISGGGLKCSTTGSAGCSSPEPVNARIDLTATPNAGNAFSGWSGACSGSAATCTVLMSAAESVSATFTASSGGGGGGGSDTDALSIVVDGGGTVTAGTTKCSSTGAKPIGCTANIQDGTAVPIKATPLKGYKFAGWKGACAGTKTTCTLTLNGDASVQATFTRLPIAAGAKKPAVAKLRTGFRVTLSFLAGAAGKLTVTTKPKTTKLVKTVKAGANTVRFTVKKHGTYTFTLSLRSKSGTHALHYKVKV